MFKFNRDYDEKSKDLFPHSTKNTLSDEIPTKEQQRREQKIKEYCNCNYYNYIPMSMGDRAEFIEYLGEELHQKELSPEEDSKPRNEKERKHMETYVALNLIKTIKEKMVEKEKTNDILIGRLKEHNRRFLKKASSEVKQFVTQFNLDVRKPMISNVVT